MRKSLAICGLIWLLASCVQPRPPTPARGVTTPGDVGTVSPTDAGQETAATDVATEVMGAAAVDTAMEVMDAPADVMAAENLEPTGDIDDVADDADDAASDAEPALDSEPAVDAQPAPDAMTADVVADTGCKIVVLPSLKPLPVMLPAQTTTVVDGLDRTILVGLASAPTAALSNDATASCATGQNPWLAAFAAPIPATLALQGNGDVLIGVAGGEQKKATGKAIGLAFGFAVHANGTASAPTHAVESPEPPVYVCNNCTSMGGICSNSVEMALAAVPSTAGTFRAVRLLSYEAECDWSPNHITALKFARMDPGGAVLEPAVTMVGACGSTMCPTTSPIFVSLGMARVLPEGGQLFFTREHTCFPVWSSRLFWFPDPGGFETQEQYPIGPIKPMDIPQAYDTPFPRALDKLGDWWTALYPDDPTPTSPQIVIVEKTNAESCGVQLAGDWQATGLVLETGDHVVVAGMRPAVTGQAAIVVERRAAQDWTLVWRTTIAAPFAQQVHAVERLPAGGTLVVTSRNVGASHAVALLWLDAFGTLVHERTVAIPEGPVEAIRSSVRVDGSAVIAVNVAKTWKIATLAAPGNWKCHPATQPCPPCDDDNPCTNDVCVAGTCLHEAAATSSCATCNAGVCIQCKDPPLILDILQCELYTQCLADENVPLKTW